MKKIFYSLSLFLALLCFGSIQAQDNKAITNSLRITQPENVNVLRQSISRPISRLQVQKLSSVELVYDTANYIDVYYNPAESDPIIDEFITIKGMTLIIDDVVGEAFYEVHLKESDLKFVKRDLKASIIYRKSNQSQTASTNETVYDNDTLTINNQSDYPNSSNIALKMTLEEAKQQLEEAKKQLRESKKQQWKNHGEIITETVIAEDEESEIEDPEDYIEAPIEVETVYYGGDSIDNDEYHYTTKPFNKTIHSNYYDWEERLHFAALTAFNNWGDQWYNGLSKLDGAYSLKTSFSSFQFEIQYSLIMTRHFNFNLGVGFERDQYLFTTPLVNCTAGGTFYDMMNYDYSDYSDFIANNREFDGTNLNDWSSRVLTKYVSLPVSIGFRNDDFSIGITAIPALSINTKKGLNHIINRDNVDAVFSSDISKHIEPYKLDLRLDLRYQWFGVFAQVSTMPLFKSTSSLDIYPFKIGFIFQY